MSFRNEPVLELRRAPARESLLEALRALDAKLPLQVPVLSAATRPGRGLRLHRPGRARSAWWPMPGAPRRTTPPPRSRPPSAASASGPPAPRPSAPRCSARAAQILRERRLELAALQVRECAKPWPEADGDVCEAIDFLEYYAREAVALDEGRALVQVPGERNTMRYAPRGVAAVIAPWNFPLAIPCGMTAAALAAGNAAVLKPAEQSPASAGALVDALHEAGVPRDALSLLPGFGEVGAALVRDPRVHVIAFTGSSAVGLEILRAAADTPEGQGHVKRVVSEMGGKNCVIVDADADLDEVVPEVVYSAFGYAGQKCSAAARVLVHEAAADTLLERLAGAIRVLDVGQAERFATEVPPVIEREAQERVRALRRDGPTVLAEAEAAVPAEGWFCPPRADGRPPGRLAGAERGDLRPAARGHRACATWTRRATSSTALPFALTGGLFSRSPRDDRAGGGPAAGGQPVRQPRDHRARWWAGSRSAATGARGSARRRAGRTTCCSSWSRAS